VADARCYGQREVYEILKAHGAKIPVSFPDPQQLIKLCFIPSVFISILFPQRNRRTPMMVSTPGDVPEYELNPAELQFRRGQEVPTVRFSLSNIQFCFFVPVTSVLRTECDFVGDKDGRNGLTLYTSNRARTSLQNGTAPRSL
jgi:hypothetical protein